MGTGGLKTNYAMAESMEKSKIVNLNLAVVLSFSAVLLLGTLLGGCSSMSPWARARRLSYERKLSSPYDQIKVKQSVIHDAVPKIQRLEDKLDPGFGGAELISHSENVVVSLGQSKDGYKTWFNMVTFQENKLNVIRKYFFIVDDKPRYFQLVPSGGLRFDCEMALQKQLLDDPDAAEHVRQIAMLRHVLDNLHKDIDELDDNTDMPGQENKMLDICRILINQAFDAVLLKLNNSPVSATRLGQADGVEFSHINFNKGTIQMVAVGNIVSVNIRSGIFAKKAKIENSQSKVGNNSKRKKERAYKPSPVFR